MEESRYVPINVLNGLAGGACISFGSLTAIGFTENTSMYGMVVAFVIIGALLCIVLDTLKCGTTVIALASAALFLIGRAIAPIGYAASGAVMYMGCVLALPEADTFTNAVTGGAAAVGFLTAVVLMM